MSEQDNVKVVQQAYANFKSGNIEALLNLLSPNVEWQLPEIENIPFAGQWHGRDEVAKFFAHVGESQDVRKFEPREFVAQGNKVVALGQYEWQVKSTGRSFASDWAHVFTIEGGKIVAFQEFTDTAAGAAAYQKAARA